ncbi:ion transporter [Candidatus Gracilibacteria bacterium]|nr:ion transporter [Candidatus Gracilibacteria bacterium]
MPKIINGFLVFLIVLSIAVLPLHFLPSPDWVHDYLIFFDKFIITVFTVEYILRIWSARRPLRYIFSKWGAIDLIAIIPFYLAKMSLLSAPEIFFGFRILRILKLGKIYDIERAAILDCAKDSHGEFRVLEGEEIEHVVRKHPLVFLLNLLLPLSLTTTSLTVLVFFQANLFAVIFTCLFLFFAGIFFFKAWLDFNYDVIYITNRRIILQNRELFGAFSNDISYESITNVKPDNTGILHWLLKFGNIQIETAAIQGTLYFHDAPNPHEVVRHIIRNRQKILENNRDNFHQPKRDNLVSRKTAVDF